MRKFLKLTCATCQICVCEVEVWFVYIPRFFLFRRNYIFLFNNKRYFLKYIYFSVKFKYFPQKILKT